MRFLQGDVVGATNAGARSLDAAAHSRVFTAIRRVFA